MKARIWTVIPHCYSDEKVKLMRAYDRFMQLLPENDWGLILDHDTFFTNKNWYRECEKAIQQYPSAGMFTVKESVPYDSEEIVKHKFNRVKIKPTDSISQQKRNASVHYLKNKGKVVLYPNQVTGYFMLIKKNVWQEVNKEIRNRFNRVDKSIGKQIRKLGYKIYCIEGIFMCHYNLRKSV